MLLAELDLSEQCWTSWSQWSDYGEDTSVGVGPK